MNSPESLVELWRLASIEKGKDVALEEKVYRAELIREIGLKCIGFNGVCLSFSLQHPILLVTYVWFIQLTYNSLGSSNHKQLGSFPCRSTK